MTLKEELIYLLIKQVSYRDRWLYLSHRQKVDPQEGQPGRQTVQALCDQGIFPSQHRQLFQDWSHHLPRLQALAQQALMIGEAAYPDLWLQIYQPPLVVFYQGHLNWLKNPLLAVVGSRKLSAYGQAMGLKICQQLSKAGYTLVSGLAKGADAIAHQACLASPGGRTIAIIASGHQLTYPKDHQALQDHLMREHLVLSEYLPDQGVRKYQFIARNRLVAGIAPATLVIQAAQRSGSLITANYALAFNRQVYALPGPINDQQSSGCNHLIAAGASPVLDPQELIVDLNTLYQRQGYLNRSMI